MAVRPIDGDLMAVRPIDVVVAELDQLGADLANTQRQVLLLIVSVGLLCLLMGGLLWRH